jgi:hypothetical protein
MHLRKKDRYRQHIALQKLEQDGHAVFYVTSQIASFEELTLAYTSNTILNSAAALFVPSEIKLPNRSKPHHLSFEASGTFANIYSTEGKRFERKYQDFHAALETNLLPRRNSEAINRKLLADIAIRLLPPAGATREIADRFEDPVIRASVLAFLTIDAQLTFFKPKEI